MEQGFDAVRVLMWCPRCHEQHVDESDAKPHTVHRCYFCDMQWRFTDWNSLGVMTLPHQDYFSRNAKPHCFATLKDFDEAVETATQHHKLREDEHEAMAKRIIDGVKEAVKPKESAWASEIGCALFIVAIALVILAVGVVKWMTLK